MYSNVSYSRLQHTTVLWRSGGAVRHALLGHRPFCLGMGQTTRGGGQGA